MKQLLFIPLIFSLFLFPSSVYAEKIVKILIVPGHDDKIWGSQYGNVKEADMNLSLGTEIFNLLKKDKRFDVQITRNREGYVPLFDDYFTQQEKEITSFKHKARELIEEKVLGGLFVKKDGVPHIAVKSYMSNVLYGINKWSNENNIDMVLHIHFNDYPRKSAWTKGKYKGFSIYVPEKQMENSTGSILLGKSIHKELLKKYATSTYEKEIGGLIEDQSLIALGSNGTLASSVHAVLVEYGYIYRFGNSNFRSKAYKNMADLTVAGIKNYFFPR